VQFSFTDETQSVQSTAHALRVERPSIDLLPNSNLVLAGLSMRELCSLLFPDALRANLSLKSRCVLSTNRAFSRSSPVNDLQSVHLLWVLAEYIEIGGAVKSHAIRGFRLPPPVSLEVCSVRR
jgi:hypothetical protein